MAKFNFFRSEKKEELKPNEIQQEIDNKVKRIEKLENEIDKADDFLNVIVDSQKKEVKNRNQEIENKGEEVERKIEAINSKKESLKKKRSTVVTKAEKELKKISKVKQGAIEKATSEKEDIKEEAQLKKQQKEVEVNKHKKEQDKKSEVKRKALVAEANEKKNDLSVKASKALELQKAELEKLQLEINKQEVAFENEKIELEKKLQKELEKQKINQEEFNQEIANAKSSNENALSAKRAELNVKVEQWKKDFDHYAEVNQGFIEKKKTELEILKNKERELEVRLRHDIRSAELEHKKIKNDHKLKMEELDHLSKAIDQKLMVAQKNYESENNLYEEEVLSFQQVCKEEQDKTEELIARLGNELNQYKEEISKQCIDLETQFNTDCDSITNFYQAHLASEEEKLQNEIRSIEEDMRRDEENFYIDKKSLDEKRSLLENKYLQLTNNIKNDLVKWYETMKGNETNYQNKMQSIANDFMEQKTKLEQEIEAKEKEINDNKEKISNEVKDSKQAVKNQLKKLELVKINFDKEYESIMKSLDILKEDNASSIKDKEHEIVALRGKLDTLNDDIDSCIQKRSDEKLRHGNRMEELQNSRNEIIEEHNKKKEEIQNIYDLKIKELEDSTAARKNEIIKVHDEQIAEINANHEEKCRELEKNKENILSQFQIEMEQYTDKIKELEVNLSEKVIIEESKLQKAKTKSSVQKEKQEIELRKIHLIHQDELDELNLKIQSRLEELNKQDEEYRFDISVKLGQARDEVRRLKDEENNLLEQMTSLQNQFNQEKNELVRTSSAYVDKHLEKVADLENQIAIKKEESQAAENSLQELIQFYVEAERDEQEKLAELKNILAREEIDQSQELEILIVQVDAQKNSNIEVLKAKHEADKKLLLQQLNDEIASFQIKIEDEKQYILEEQEQLDKQYEEKLKENKIIIDSIKSEIETLQKESKLEQTKYESEISKFEKSYSFEKKQLEYEFELKNTNYAQQIDELRATFEQEQSEINLEKVRISNAIELKQKALDDRKKMFDSFFASFEFEENLRKNDREKEIKQYEDSIADIERQVSELQAELDNAKATNLERIEEIKNQQREARAEIDDLVTRRNERFKQAIDEIKNNHEREINEFMSQCNAQQAELVIQNENILKPYKEDFDDYKSKLLQELEQRQMEIAKLINEKEVQMNEEKVQFENQFRVLREEENNKIELRNNERIKFTEYWDATLQAIRVRISAIMDQFSKDEEQLRIENESRIQVINNERIRLEDEERKTVQRIQEAEVEFNEKKRKAEEKSRQYEEECYQKIAEIERLIKQKENKINSYHEDIKKEIHRAEENRKLEEKRLNDILLSKNQLLADEHEKISTVIQKQQRIFDKLSAKKRAAMEQKNAQNNKILEKELRRIELEKEKAGEDFSLSLDELEKEILKKEEYYENLIAQQRIQNEEYLEDYKKTLQKNQQQQILDNQGELEIAMKLENELLENENQTLENINQELSKIKNDHINILDSLQESNNQVSNRLTILRKQYDQINTNFLSDSDSQKYLDLFEDFDQKINERRQYLSKLEKDETDLRKEKLEQLAEQNEDYNQMVMEHQEKVIAIENEIYKEQRRLTDFEEEMSDIRREQKEEEIYKKNLFVKKLEYLKQKMTNS